MNYASRASPPWKLEFRSSRRFVISVVAMAVFTDVFIYGMIVPILPVVLKTRVVVPDDQLQQWMAIMLAAFGGAIFVGSPIFGYFADKGTSRQVPFIFGLLALGGSTIMFWVARSLSSLVIARVLQGLSAAVVWTVGMALVVDTVGKDQVGAAMGYVSMAMTVGTVFGPFIGGVVLSRISYDAVFTIAVGLVVLDILLRLFMIEQKTALKWTQPQIANETESLLSSADETGNGVYQATRQDRSDQISANPCHSVCWPEVSGEPISSGRTSTLPPIVRLMCSSSVLLFFGATIVDAILWSSFDTVLPLHVMETFNWSPFWVGVCFLPLFAPSFFSPLVGDAVDRYGSRTIAFLGFLLDFPTFFLLRLITHDTTQDQILLYIFLFIAGIASTLQMVSLMTEVSLVVERQEKESPGIFGNQGGMGQAYGLFNVAWSGGQVLGPLIAGLLSDRGGWVTMVSVFGTMSGVTAVVIGFSDKKVLRCFGQRT
ncbi:major facilitator superfamily domain-containing protein [Aspergillus pseudonomiae]|uniref:Major facilitator superfamily domain-containing protein n=1 Tax=Aspergillus pseudonomiae TaxID=1506151 RepID=A0A5N6I2R1_9EURO|nr:major facilitator superfamily domain-containing protein [Aspergillus pseudonomiae]KAB8260678.1 major facilitator superfamily domain-containing protein [Aspergillus pseudonomiae]KAE8406350.1 major facilitator superfamily domain-containing protein [Aspergillus pseudonomiae]